MFAKLATIAAACLVATAAGKEHIQAAIRRGEVTSRAANLGGWLLSECWMSYNSPLYKGVPESVGYTGEYGVMKFLGKEKGTKQFEEHWQTWITEKDIAEIAKAGLNTVRVSTGYWIINDEDTTDASEITNTYAKGGLKYLDTLINEWAVKYNLAVMVSLHAHKGSQNGLDHSAPVTMWKTTWGQSEADVKSSFNYATFIAHRYKNSKAFLGLNLMNEPTTGVEYTTLHKYYKDAYKAIRKDGNDCIIVTSPLLPDQGPPVMADFMPCPEYYNVWHEFHVYYKWGWEQATFDGVLAGAAKYADDHFKWWTGNPIFLGEWSLATSKETETDEQLTKFAEVHMKEAEKSPAGWAFWAWRHDDESKKTSGWSMRQLIRKGILTIPTDTPHALKRKESCPVIEYSHNSSSDGSAGDVGSSKKNESELPGKVVAADPGASLNSNSTLSTTKTPAPTKSGVSSLQVASASAAVAVASVVAMLL